MKNKDGPSCAGFTLAEILVGILLLSIVAVGSFKTFHFSQRSANSNLVEFQRLQINQQLNLLQRIRLSYLNINAESEYELLNCLIANQENCELIP